MDVNKRRKAALVGCSDPLDNSMKDEIVRLAQILSEEGLQVEISPFLFEDEVIAYISGREKAEALNVYFQDPEMAFIFDVSGGDLANSVLPYLNYDAIRESKAVFFGFSDLTTVINAIIAKTGKAAVNYQVRNLLRDKDGELLDYFRNHILKIHEFLASESVHELGHESVHESGHESGNESGHESGHELGNESGNITADYAVDCQPAETANPLMDPLEIHFLRGTSMEGRILGGNVRCFLKLAGTPYWPDLDGAILLLEAYGGGVNQMVTALNQYQQLGVLDRIRGVLLGTFTYMEKNHISPAMRDMVLEMLPKGIPVAETRYVGHGRDARGIILGQYTYIGS